MFSRNCGAAVPEDAKKHTDKEGRKVKMLSKRK